MWLNVGIDPSFDNVQGIEGTQEKKLGKLLVQELI
jgi:hypothetical protein